MPIQKGKPSLHHRTGVYLSVDNTYQMVNWVKSLKKMNVTVGPSAGTNERHDDRTNPIGNIALAYIHEYGAPASGIPARPFMKPGILAVRPYIIQSLRTAANESVAGNKAAARGALQMLGIQAVAGMRKVMLTSVPPPLSPRRMRERAKKGSNYITLMDTLQLYNSLTYQVRM